MTGFCFGGGMTWLMATRVPELRAAVPFYGPNPPLDDVPNIEAAVLAIYAEDDAWINAGIPAIEAAMQEHGKTFEKVVYPVWGTRSTTIRGVAITRRPRQTHGRGRWRGSKSM